MGDYDYEPKTGPSLFLRLKTKGEIAVIRIASAPHREPIVWKEGMRQPLSPEETARLSEAQWAAIMRDPQFTISEAYHWVVIDRADGQAKIFTGTAGIYKSIKEYAQMQQWGDPREYDIEITRTEEPGRNYYKVTPYPSKEPLRQAELELVDAINLIEKRPNAAPTSERQLDDISEWLENQKQAAPAMGSQGTAVGSGGSSTPGYDKAKATAHNINKKTDQQSADEAADKAAAENLDTIVDDIGDEPINLDDIPF